MGLFIVSRGNVGGGRGGGLLIAHAGFHIRASYWGEGEKGLAGGGKGEEDRYVPCEIVGGSCGRPGRR